MDKGLRKLSERGCKVLSEPPFKYTDRVLVECPEGHIKSTTIRNASLDRASCKECSGKKVTKESFVKRLAEKGIVLLTEYKTLNKGGTLYHSECDHTWTIGSLSGIYKNEGCPKCAGNLELSDEDLKVFFNNLEYDLLKAYRSRGVKTVRIQCQNCSSINSGRLSGYRHRNKSCICTRDGGKHLEARYSLPHYLYYIKFKISGKVYYKIGITCKDIEKRFYKGDRENMKVLKYLECDNREKAYTLEQYFLTTFSEYRYRGSPILLSGGNTELFTKDVLELDT